jgi:intracellular septation protein A
MKKFVKVVPLLVFVAGFASAQTATVDIGTAGATAVTASTLYIAAAGGAALALWGLKAPIRIGINFLKTMFK